MVDNGLYFFFFFENSGEVAENKELAKELHKPMIKKVWKTKKAFTFYRQCCIANMQLLSYNHYSFFIMWNF